MTTNRYRLEPMPKAQCHVTIQRRSINDFEARLISYSTVVLVAHYTNDALELLCSGTYSVTTARHINRFTTQFFGKNLYYPCKEATDNSGAFRVVAVYSPESTEAERFKATVKRYETGEHVPRYRGCY